MKYITVILAIMISSPLFAKNHIGHNTHDFQRMPHLNGKNTTEVEVEDMRHMFHRHFEITREVVYMENGIQTITRTKNPKLVDALIRHVIMMLDRMENKNNPEVPIQSPQLDYLFMKSDKIRTGFEALDDGIIVVQTSTNPEVIQSLHKHASEVTDMVDRGMQVVHERMMGH